MEKPSAKVAIITRTKNRNLLLARALQSVANQSFANYILVIINDGGDKQAIENLLARAPAKLAGKYIVIHNESSVGMEAASNLGIRNSSSEYVVIHDDDDSWQVDFLRETVALLDSKKNSKTAGAITYFTKIIERVENNSVSEIERIDAANWIEEISLWRMFAGNFFPPIAFIYRRDVFEKLSGLYREDLPVLGDWEFNIRFLKQFDIALIKKHLAFYHHRVHGNSTAYENTVVAGIEKHQSINAQLRNEALINYVHDAKQTQGLAWNIAYNLKQIENKNQENFDQLINSLNQLGNKISGLENKLTELENTQQISFTNISIQIAEQRHIIGKIYGPVRRIRRLFGKKD